MRGELRIGSRGSALAVAQAEIVRGRIACAFPGLSISHHIISTVGDRSVSLPLHRISSVGLFVKEIEEALLDEEIDLAIHSLKDMPIAIPEGLTIASVLERGDVRDALVSGGSTLESLQPGATIGTSSLRREGQIRKIRPDLEVMNIRGNIDTRLEKLDRGEYDAIVLAACGLDRIGLSARISERIQTEIMLPAACQGILALETRANDETSVKIAVEVGNTEALLQAETERAFISRIEGGCRVPVGCVSSVEPGRVSIEALIASIDGQSVVRSRISGPIDERLTLSRGLAEELLAKGGDKILDAARTGPTS